MEEAIENRVSIKYWSEDDRPREKLLEKGKAALSDAELLAILFGSGTRNESALDLARRVLKEVPAGLDGLAKSDIHSLRSFRGIGTAKALTIIAAFELGRRRVPLEVKKSRITSSRAAFETIFPDLSDLGHEEFWIILLDRANGVVGKRMISKGGVAGTVADIRLIFKPAIEQLCSAIIVAHNHPSGNLTPSEADKQLTKKLSDTGRIMDIPVLDHIIVGHNNYFSFADEGIL